MDPINDQTSKKVSQNLKQLSFNFCEPQPKLMKITTGLNVSICWYCNRGMHLIQSWSSGTICFKSLIVEPFQGDLNRVDHSNATKKVSLLIYTQLILYFISWYYVFLYLKPPSWKDLWLRIFIWSLFIQSSLSVSWWTIQIYCHYLKVTRTHIKTSLIVSM